MTDKNWSDGLFTDKEYIEELGLDPALEGSEAINKAIQNSVIQSTARRYVEQGIPPNRAEKIAMREVRRKK